MNLDHIADDIRHVTDILKAENDTMHAKRLDLLQADMTQAMIDFGRSEVENRMVAAIKDAEGKGAKW